MAESVGSMLLKFGLGFISDKFRTYGAETLQGGGLTDQKFRGLIVRELDDITSKLDALSRKDLSASISFLQKGIQRLQTRFEFGNSSTSKLPTYRRDLIDMASTGPSSSQTKPVQLQSVSVEDAVALANAIGKLKIESKEQFESKECFKKAGEKATEAFHNAALSTDERILATEVRIASAILENLEDPRLAATDCLLYLKELHTLSAIKDIFSVHIQGGIKSLFKKDSREQIVETVTRINLMLADFITKFTKRRMGVLDWPMIECSKQVVHPIHYQKESLRKLEEMKITPPWDIVKTASLHSHPVAINSKGDVIFIKNGSDRTENCLQKYVRGTGEWKSFCSFPPNFVRYVSIAIDDNDTVYFVWRNYEFKYILSVYSSDGKHTHSCPLDFIDGIFMGMSVTKKKNIVFWTGSIYKSVSVSVSVYVCDILGKLIKSFPSLVQDVSQTGTYVSLDNSADNDITVVACSYSFEATMLFVFTQERKLKRTIKLPSYCPFGYLTTFDHDTGNYVCANYYGQTGLECFSETGELRNKLLLDASFTFAHVASHPNGAMAILSKYKIYHLRSP